MLISIVDWILLNRVYHDRAPKWFVIVVLVERLVYVIANYEEGDRVAQDRVVRASSERNRACEWCKETRAAQRPLRHLLRDGHSLLLHGIFSLFWIQTISDDNNNPHSDLDGRFRVVM